MYDCIWSISCEYRFSTFRSSFCRRFLTEFLAEAEAATIAKIESFIFSCFIFKLVGFDGLSGLNYFFYTVEISELVALFPKIILEIFYGGLKVWRRVHSGCGNDCITYAPFKCNIRVRFPK